MKRNKILIIVVVILVLGTIGLFFEDEDKPKEKAEVSSNLDVTDEELDAKCEEIGKMYGMELDKVKETFGEEGLNQIKEDIKVEKAADFVRVNAVEK